MTAALLGEQLTQAAVERRRPDGATYRSLATASVQQLAERLGVGPRLVEQAALALDIIPERYARNMTSFSAGDQARLLGATACIAGVGGLGGHVAEILARIGVGGLRLVDGDHFEDSNLNRQRFAEAATLGQPKAPSVRERLAAVNPAVEITAFAEQLTLENGPRILGEADIAIDCLDSLTARLALQEACRRNAIPMVSAAVAGMSGQLTVILPEDEGLAALYGDLDAAPDRGAETTLGNLPFAVALLASLESAEAVKLLLGSGRVLRHRLLVFDLAEPVFDIIELA
jgi:molybdopterin/thiamine biosynthesis adenylyltransferase